MRTVGNDTRATAIREMKRRHKNDDVLSNLDVWRLCSLFFKTDSFKYSEHIEEVSIKTKRSHLILNSVLLCPSLQKASSSFLKQITAKSKSFSVILKERWAFFKPEFVIIALSVKFFRILHTARVIMLENREKEKLLSVTEKASGISDVSLRREIALPINSSLPELTSKVPEPFPYC